jgi:hypothetical protein
MNAYCLASGRRTRCMDACITCLWFAFDSDERKCMKSTSEARPRDHCMHADSRGSNTQPASHCMRTLSTRQGILEKRIENTNSTRADPPLVTYAEQ